MAELTVRGTRFHVQRLGAGDRIVVFLHGLIMDNLSSWYFSVANPVATRAEVLLYDLRGHGRSERTPTGYTLADMVADLDALLDAAGLAERPVTLVGNSFGGLLGLSFALAHPDRVGGLVLVDAHLSDAGWAERMQHTLSLQGAERDLLIARHFKDWAGRHSRRKSNRLASHARALVEETSLVADLGATPAYDDEQLRAIRCPTLALYGEESDILAHGRRIAAALPDCELRIYAGCTHSILWEATARLRDDVLAWITPAPPGA